MKKFYSDDCVNEDDGSIDCLNHLMEFINNNEFNRNYSLVGFGPEEQAYWKFGFSPSSHQEALTLVEKRHLRNIVMSDPMGIITKYND